MNDNDTILGSIDPDISERLISRRDAILRGAAASSTVLTGLAMASVPVALAALSKEAFGQSTPLSLQQVLNFALMLEIFEDEFYKAVLGKSSLASQNAVFATVRTKVPAAALPAIQQISKHESAHVAFLTNAGAQNTLNLSASSFDFTGGRGSGSGPFAAAGTDLNFLLLTAEGAEDTGVRAYKGQAPNLQASTAANASVVLESALRIHSVEARHASKLRRLRRLNGLAPDLKLSGTITGGGAAAAGVTMISNPPSGAVTALGLIYGGEDNTTQGGVNLLTLPNLPSGLTGATLTAAATEAFDEPLAANTVIDIVQPFFIPTLTKFP